MATSKISESLTTRSSVESRSWTHRRVLALLMSSAILLVFDALIGTSPASAALPKNVLVFSKTDGFRHSSIPAGIAAVQQLGSVNGFGVTATEDATSFTPAILSRYQAVIFLSTTGDVLNNTQQAAFESYLASGGGFVGVHSASDTEYDWPWYGGLVGTYFAGHPPVQMATLNVEDRTTVATAHLGATWDRSDEWYNFRTSPRASARVLLSLSEASYSGGTMGDHPIAWCQNYGGGRSFYTGLGHTEASFADTDFTRFLLGGIRIAAGWASADCTPEAERVVGLRASVNDRYVVAESAGSAPLLTNRVTMGLWEEFDLVDRGGGKVALRSHANNSYVCAEAAGTAPLIANRGTVGEWETFTLVYQPDGRISLRATANGRYVTAEDGGRGALIANRTAIGWWETFDLVSR